MPFKTFGQYGTVRDYLYVSDLVSGIVSALEYGHFSDAYNLVSGIGFSKSAVVKEFRPLLSEIGCEVDLENFPELAFDVKANVHDSARMQIDAGWKPRVGFKEELIITRDWLMRQPA